MTWLASNWTAPNWFGAYWFNEEVIGGGGYISHESDYIRGIKNARLLALEKELAEKQLEISVIEQQQKEIDEKLAAAALEQEQNAAIELAALEAQLQELINVLRIERARLMQLIAEEDDFALLVMAVSLIH